MNLTENQSCDFWIDENNRTDQNWSDIETEYLELCVGPQRSYKSHLNLNVVFLFVLQAT